MQKNEVTNGLTAMQTINAGKPAMPLAGRQTFIERKVSDPSSAYPKGQRYPIPSFFEYRVKPRDFDPL